MYKSHVREFKTAKAMRNFILKYAKEEYDLYWLEECLAGRQEIDVDVWGWFGAKDPNKGVSIQTSCWTSGTCTVSISIYDQKYLDELEKELRDD